MAPHSSTLAWKIPWKGEPGRLQSMGLLRVGHDWATSLWLFTFMHWRRKWQLTPVFLPGESQERGAWWAAVYGVTQSRTRLKRLSSSRSVFEICNGNFRLAEAWSCVHVWLQRKLEKWLSGTFNSCTRRLFLILLRLIRSRIPQT